MSLYRDYVPVHVPFSARLWIDADGVRDISAWVHELDQPTTTGLSGAEWVVDHLQSCYSREEFNEWFKLDPAKCYQVIFRGTLNGFWSGLPGEEEYDEYIDVEDFVAAGMPSEYLAERFGPDVGVSQCPE